MSKVLVTFFSASGVTKKVAVKLASVLNADLHEIIPEKPYSKEDLDWTNDNSRSTIEMKKISQFVLRLQTKWKIWLITIRFILVFLFGGTSLLL